MGKVPRFPIYSLLPSPPPIIDFSHQSGAFVIINKSTKSIVYIRVHSWCWPRKILTRPKLSYSRLDGGKKRQEVKQLTESRAEISKGQFTFLNVCWNFEPTSRQLFGLLSEEKSWLPGTTASPTHAVSGLLPAIDPTTANTSSLWTMHLFQNFLHLTFSSPLVYSQCTLF